jgi:predicted permease
MVYVLINGICSPYGPLSGYSDCDSAFSYISIFALPEMLLFWTVGYSLVALDKAQSAGNTASNSLTEVEVRPKRRLWRNMAKTVLMPNPLCCIAGMVLALIPGFQQVFFDKHSEVYCFAHVGLALGNTGIIFSQILLGSNVYLLKGTKSMLPFKAIIFTAVCKNIVVPGISFGVIYGVWIGGVFGENLVLAYVIFICVSCPTAIVCMLFANLHKIGVSEVSQTLFWVYMMSFPAIIFWTFLFFSVL